MAYSFRFIINEYSRHDGVAWSLSLLVFLIFAAPIHDFRPKSKLAWSVLVALYSCSLLVTILSRNLLSNAAEPWLLLGIGTSWFFLFPVYLAVNGFFVPSKLDGFHRIMFWLLTYWVTYVGCASFVIALAMSIVVAAGRSFIYFVSLLAVCVFCNVVEAKVFRGANWVAATYGDTKLRRLQ